MSQPPAYSLCAVVAMTPQRIIGKDGSMPWHLPEDLKLFRSLTTGHPILMGRKTYESIGRPLPQRQNIVLTRQKDWQPEGVTVIHHLDELAELELIDPKVMLIGGGQLYALLLEHCDELYVSELHTEYEGDTTFPEYKQYFSHVERVSEFAGFTLFRYSHVRNKS